MGGGRERSHKTATYFSAKLISAIRGRGCPPILQLIFSPRTGIFGIVDPLNLMWTFGSIFSLIFAETPILAIVG